MKVNESNVYMRCFGRDEIWKVGNLIHICIIDTYFDVYVLWGCLNVNLGHLFCQWQKFFFHQHQIYWRTLFGCFFKSLWKRNGRGNTKTIEQQFRVVLISVDFNIAVFCSNIALYNKHYNVIWIGPMHENRLKKDRNT